jgi:hypothetical protein
VATQQGNEKSCHHGRVRSLNAATQEHLSDANLVNQLGVASAVRACRFEQWLLLTADLVDQGHLLSAAAAVVGLWPVCGQCDVACLV